MARSAVEGLLFALLLMLPLNAPAAQKDRTEEILSFLRASNVEGMHSRWDFAYASVPASNQAPSITVVYLTNTGWCGTGGCHLLILSEKDGRYRVLRNIPVVEEPITMLGRAKDGYPVFGINFKDFPPNGGQGPMVLYPGALVPKKGVYPETVNEAVRLRSRALGGRVLISEAIVDCNFRRANAMSC